MDAPAHYLELLEGLPDDVAFLDERERELDLVHLFVRRRAALEAAVPRLRPALRPAGALWVSWPKKASGEATDLTEDVVRGVALANQLVDVKVCAVDATWSGLKLVIPVALRG